MITLRIKCICEEVIGFLREVEIPIHATFYDLSKTLLDSCGYADDQMTSFYLCDSEWQRGLQITREDMGFAAADEDVYVMQETKLSDLIEEGQHLEYIFDPFNDRTFSLIVKEEIFGHELKEPKVLKSKGVAPKQIKDLDYSPVTETKGKGAKKGNQVDSESSLFDDINSFEDDELDLSGFEISDGDSF